MAFHTNSAVTSQPYVAERGIGADDMFVLIASRATWDVMTYHEAAERMYAILQSLHFNVRARARNVCGCG